jgi:hypothetical protein
VTRDRLIRAAYLVAALAPLGAGVGAALFAASIFRMAGGDESFKTFALLPLGMAAAAMVGLIALFLWLARKPRWWGKLVCLIGLPWIMFSAMGTLIMHVVPGASTGGLPFADPVLLYTPGLSGALLLAVGVTLGILDPRFGDAPKPTPV